MNNGITFQPIGIFRSHARFPYEARRQGSADTSGDVGVIELNAGHGFEQALDDLKGFDRIWLVYHFHENPNWKPKVMPPRGPRVKRGVFATRAPYRPNPIGMSCVRLIDIKGLKLFVEEHDLLDGTPILDIKPYIPYADAFPEARTGWLEEVEARRWHVEFMPDAEERLTWLGNNGAPQIRGFLQAQLEYEPLDEERKRVQARGEKQYCLAYRTWRADFTIHEATSEDELRDAAHRESEVEPNRVIQVLTITSGYTPQELASNEDLYQDKDLHRQFHKRFGSHL